MKTKPAFVSPIIIFCFLITSCSPGQLLSPMPTATPTLTVVPTITPTLTATITPTFTQTSTSTPTSTYTPTLTPTKTAIQDGIGVTRQEIQSAYEELSLKFDPPTIENGKPVVIGGISLMDGSMVGVILIGTEQNLDEVSVTILEPSYLISDNKFAGKEHGKVLFVMQVLLDTVFPDWAESGTWLDESLRSFGSASGKEASVESKFGPNKLILETRVLEGEMEGYIEISLIIQAN